MRPFILLRLPIFFFVCFGASSCAYLLLPVTLPLMMVASTHWRIDYEFEVAAERQDNGHKTSLQTSGRGRKVDLVAGDDIVSFSFNVRPGGIDCTVQNEGAEPVRLRLEDARFIGPDGTEHELYAAGARNRGEPSSFLEQGSEIAIFLWPRDWLRGSIYKMKEVSREEYEQLDLANRGPIMYFERLSGGSLIEVEPEIYEQLDEDRRGGIHYYPQGERLFQTWKADSPIDGRLIAEKTSGKAKRVAQQYLGQTFEIVLPLERDGSRHIYRFHFTVADLHPERMIWS